MDKTNNTDATEIAIEETDLSPRQKLLSEVGQKLVLAREARGEQLSVVVRALKLREANLKALEEGDWDCLPDDVYALGFLRQYSSYLALDLKEEIQRIKNDQYILTRPLTFPDPPVAPSYTWAWIAGTAFIILFVAFNIISQDAMHNFLFSPKTAPQKVEQGAADATQETESNSASSAQQTVTEIEPAAVIDSPPVSAPPSEPALIEANSEPPATAEPTPQADDVPHL